MSGEWQKWVGREELRSDRIDEGAVTRWLAMLDRERSPDDTVPQAFHWCLCLPDAPTALLAADGHPVRDQSPASFLPPIPLPRRMWASSKIEFHTPLCVEDPVSRRSQLISVTQKQGGTGGLTFVAIAHDIVVRDVLAVRETQTIVYRDAAPPQPTTVRLPVGAPQFVSSEWDAHRMIVPSETLLFRYSALTFNSHRIHYDATYAREEEGYPGLVVHGPLTATLLLDLARRSFGDNALTRFDFRGVAPTYVGDPLHLVLRRSAETLELAAFADDGRQIIAATATL